MRVLDEVLAERSLTRAARNLAMTQPAVSNAIKRLRDVLGDDLVRRAAFGVEPTPRALLIWPAIRQALGSLRECLVPGEFVSAQSHTTFVLAMADATAAELMPGLIARIETQAPGISMRVLPLTTRDPRHLLEQGQIDLAVGYFPAVLADLSSQAQLIAGDAAPFAHARLYEGEYVCVMRRGHPLAALGQLGLDDYCQAHHLLVSFSGRPFGLVDEALVAVGRQRRIVLTVNQFFTAGRVVANSDLLTVLPRRFASVAQVAGDLVVRELPLRVPMLHVDALWHRSQTGVGAHQWLRTAVTEVARSDASNQGLPGKKHRTANKQAK